MKHLLDLSDLLEDELQQVYHSEKRLIDFLDDLQKSTTYQPLKDLIVLYRTLTVNRLGALEKVFYRLFIAIQDKEDYHLMQQIISEYHTSVNRTPDEAIMEEESILALLHVIHYKIASYSTLYVHAKALKYWEEMNALHIALREEKEMEADLTFLMEKHHFFLNDWYAETAK
jgi:ferritin-like metal-binding protein YciE